MLVAICHCQKEHEQVKRLAAWMAELGPYPNHRLLVGRDERAEPNLFANSGFSSVEEITIIGDAWNKWVESCNNAYRQIAKHIEYGTREPWLWLEPDVVPLKIGWVDAIEAEYGEILKTGKVFSGDLVHVPEMMNVPDHMSGVAVYPGVMSEYAGNALLAHEIGWDVVGAPQILPQMHKSKLILHRWKYPAFESWEQVEQRIFQVKPDCVLFHSDKAGSLIPLLRERLSVGEVPVGGSGIHGIKCTCAERDFPCPFHFRDNQKSWGDVTSEQIMERLAEAADSPNSESASTATSTIVAVQNGDDRASMVRDTVAILKQLCTSPVHTGQIRKELKAQGVIR